jgi:hypothetical protein
MKKLTGLCVVAFLAGFVASQVGAEDTVGPNDYYVVLKVAKTGNTIGLSEKFSNYDACINSADYQLHTLVDKESQESVQCSNAIPTYKL